MVLADLASVTGQYDWYCYSVSRCGWRPLAAALVDAAFKAESIRHRLGPFSTYGPNHRSNLGHGSRGQDVGADFDVVTRSLLTSLGAWVKADATHKRFHATLIVLGVTTKNANEAFIQAIDHISKLGTGAARTAAISNLFSQRISENSCRDLKFLTALTLCRVDYRRG